MSSNTKEYMSLLAVPPDAAGVAPPHPATGSGGGRTAVPPDAAGTVAHQSCPLSGTTPPSDSLYHPTAWFSAIAIMVIVSSAFCFTFQNAASDQEYAMIPVGALAAVVLLLGKGLGLLGSPLVTPASSPSTPRGMMSKPIDFSFSTRNLRSPGPMMMVLAALIGLLPLPVVLAGASYGCPNTDCNNISTSSTEKYITVPSTGCVCFPDLEVLTAPVSVYGTEIVQLHFPKLKNITNSAQQCDECFVVVIVNNVKLELVSIPLLERVTSGSGSGVWISNDAWYGTNVLNNISMPRLATIDIQAGTALRLYNVNAVKNVNLCSLVTVPNGGIRVNLPTTATCKANTTGARIGPVLASAGCSSCGATPSTDAPSTDAPATDAPTTTAAPTTTVAPTTTATMAPANNGPADVVGQFTLKGDKYDMLLASPQLKAKLITALREDLARILMLAIEYIRIDSLKEGSLVVDFTLTTNSLNSDTARDRIISGSFPDVQSVYRQDTGSPTASVDVQSATAEAGPGRAPAADDDSGLSGGAIAGIIVGAVVVVAPLAFVGLRLRQSRATQAQDDQALASPLHVNTESTCGDEGMKNV